MGGTTSGVLRIPSECILWEEMGVNFLHPLMGLSFYSEWSSADQWAFPDPFWGDFVHSHSVNRRLVFLQKDNSIVPLLSLHASLWYHAAHSRDPFFVSQHAHHH